MNSDERAKLLEKLQELVYHETETTFGGVQRCNFYLESEAALALLDAFERETRLNEHLRTCPGCKAAIAIGEITGRCARGFELSRPAEKGNR